jgi:hypothetical protein
VIRPPDADPSAQPQTRSPFNAARSRCSLAAAPRACTEAVMRAHGFTADQLAELARIGFAAESCSGHYWDTI